MNPRTLLNMFQASTSILSLVHAYILCIASMPCVDCFPFSMFASYRQNVNPKRRPAMPIDEYLLLIGQVKKLFLKKYYGFLKPGKLNLLSAHIWFQSVFNLVCCMRFKVFEVFRQSSPILLHHLNILIHSTQQNQIA